VTPSVTRARGSIPWNMQPCGRGTSRGKPGLARR
jgi:hypothetical protein